ncbi:MAG TPA: hypothetical protein VMW95_08855 [Desulfobacterales bacterium]|nr:hypothetical protein [Desulfobacterales bacterium]
MRKTLKKMSKTMKEDLRFLVEEFLEKFADKIEIRATIGGPGDAARILWTKIEKSLFGELPWLDEIDPEDMDGIDYEELLIRYHSVLKPIWKMFREAIFDFKYKVMPARENQAAMRKAIKNNIFSVLSEYKELLDQDSVINWEKFYDIEIKLKVSFDPGHAAFFKRKFDVLNNFLDLLQGVPIHYFAKCEYCGKCLILTRSDKRFCPGCAAKKYQKDKWASDPEGMKAKEKLRYDRFRKKK